MKLTEKTLCLLVTCNVEKTRFDILQKVIDSLKSEQATKGFSIEDDLIVFDNGSTHPDSQKILFDNFNKIYFAEENKGYWSAINWVLNTPGIIDHSKYEYIYIIESDNIHYSLEKLKNCELALDKWPRLGSIRVQEFKVAEKHLYNKQAIQKHSKRHAIFTHINQTTRKNATFTLLDEELDIYETQLSAFLCSVNRIKTMQTVFQELAKKPEFRETDFQRLYYDHYRITGQLDGGIFSSNLFDEVDKSRVVAGSLIALGTKSGYLHTRTDSIRVYPNVMSAVRNKETP